MDYEKIRELLLQDEVLNEEDAISILNEWADQPKLYQFMLEDGMAVQLYAYNGYSEDAEMHMFCETQKYVLAPRYAKHFFNQEDELIPAVFTSFIAQTIASEDEEDGTIYAWPYLNADCMENLSAGFILNIIEEPHFVFDFAEDVDCSIFCMLYQTLYEGSDFEEFLAINSFNLSSDWRDQKVCDRLTSFRNIFVASHNFGNAISEAVFRKLFINYILEIERQTSEANSQYIIDNN